MVAGSPSVEADQSEAATAAGNAVQDTSDYVSASGEELSIGDWEYQIPAPPSAFRDEDDQPQPRVDTTGEHFSHDTLWREP